MVNVGIGFKESAGERTDEISFRVYVEEKKPKESIAPEHVIPETIRGFPTDVLPVPTVELIDNQGSERPLKGGIQVNANGHTGTLGCFAKRMDDGATVLLSNHHVLYGYPESLGGPVKFHANDGDEVGQPSITCCCCCRYDIAGKNIGKVLNGLVDAAIAKVEARDNIAQNYLVTNIIKGLGVRQTDGTYSNEDAPLRGVALRQKRVKNGATVFSTVRMGERVRKVGRTTGRTVGSVVDFDAPATISKQTKDGQTVNVHRFTGGQITIVPVNNAEEFAKGGDSGSIVINDNNEVIGLLHASSEGSAPDTSRANDIHHVLQALNIRIFAPPIAKITATPTSGPAPLTVNFSASTSQDTDGTIAFYAWDSADPDPNTGAVPTGAGVTFSYTYSRPGKYKVTLTVTDNNGMSGIAATDIQVNAPTPPSAVGLSSQPEAFRKIAPPTPQAVLERVEQSLQETAQGRSFLEIVREYSDEVLTLVNRRRPVTLTWHRKNGPAYVAAIFASAREPHKQIPKEIQEVSLPSLLRNMAVVLEDHASSELKSHIQQHATSVIRIAETCKTFEDIVQKIKGQENI